MRNLLLFFGLSLSLSACKLLDTEISCSEFYVKNELSGNVFLRNYKLIDSGYYFSLDSFTIAPNETRRINQDCRYVDSTMPYPQGAYTKFSLQTVLQKSIRSIHPAPYIYTTASISTTEPAGFWKGITNCERRLISSTSKILWKPDNIALNLNTP